MDAQRFYRKRPPGGSTDEWLVYDVKTDKQVGDLFQVPFGGGWEWHYIRDGVIICGDVAVQQYQAFREIERLLDGECTQPLI